MNYGTASNQMHSFVSHSRKNSFSDGDVFRSPYSSYGNNFGNGPSPNFQQLSPLPSPRYSSSPMFNLQPKARSNSLNSNQGSISYNRSSNMSTTDKSCENSSNVSRSLHLGYVNNSRSSTSSKFQQLSPLPSQHYTSPPMFNLQPKARFSSQNSKQGSINYNRSSNLSRNSTSNMAYDNTTSDSSFSTSFNCSGNRGKYFQNSSASRGNPAHSSDIRLYVDPSMLEDPWKELMQKLEEGK